MYVYKAKSMGDCKDCRHCETCTKTIGNLFGCCEIDFEPKREQLEKAVYDIVSSDMQVCLFESDEWIRRQIKKATYEDLLEYLEDV